ncbi:MAG: hypothetical protein IT539_03965 [Bradyrhizobiaceae bacterium]|nr:hypothetical protein [Bradyrhizobiaceae bacterium]
MKCTPALAAIVLALGIIPAEAAVRSGEAYVRQVSNARDTAYVMQAGGPSVQVSVVLRSRYPLVRMQAYEPSFPIPAYVAPDIEHELLLGYLANGNRGLPEKYKRIFRDFLR